MNLKPISADELREKLNEGTVQFAFKKIGGDLRTATGTTHLDTVPVENHPTSGKAAPSGIVPFFDIVKGAWRSVAVTQEIFIQE